MKKNLKKNMKKNLKDGIKKGTKKLKNIFNEYIISSKPSDTSVLSLFKGTTPLKIKGCFGAKRTVVNYKVLPVYAWYVFLSFIGINILWPLLLSWG